LSIYPVDYTAGTSATLVKNVGQMKSTGVDVELNSVNTRGKLQWTTNLLFSYNEDKISDYYLASQRANQLLTSSASISGVIGKPAYSLFAYKWMGLDPATGDPQSLYNGNISKDYNVITGSTLLISDLDYKGPVIAPFFGSLGNTFSYKNFSATARFIYKFGNNFRRESIRYANLVSNGQGHSDYALRWKKPGDEPFTNVPSFFYPASSNRDLVYTFSDALIEPAAFVRLQYIDLSYNWKNIGRALPFKVLKIYCNAANLGLVYRANKNNIDPEYQGLNFPPGRTLAFGINASF
jgi:TonB-dependent starch-binding outer membrane protein SusC